MRSFGLPKLSAAAMQHDPWVCLAVRRVHMHVCSLWSARWLQQPGDHELDFFITGNDSSAAL